MLAIPSPRGSRVLRARDRPGRAVRVTAHPELGRVVISTWQGDRCVSTVRLAPQDVEELVTALAAAAVDADPLDRSDAASGAAAAS